MGANPIEGNSVAGIVCLSPVGQNERRSEMRGDNAATERDADRARDQGERAAPLTGPDLRSTQFGAPHLAVTWPSGKIRFGATPVDNAIISPRPPRARPASETLPDSGHRPDGVPRHATRRGLRHIGGLMPSFSTYMKFAVTLPSSPLGPARNTAAPGFSRLLSPGTGARIGTSGPMLYSDSPS